MAAIDYRPKQVRLFLAILLALCAFITLKTAPRDGSARLIGWAAEALTAGFFLLQPKLFFPIFKVILTVTSKFGNLIFLLASLIVFYVLLTPLALVMRLFGKKFVLTRIQPDQASYFEAPDRADDFERQF